MIRGLAPSILSFDLCAIGPSVQTMVAAGAPVVHLDVMDGQFVPPITFGDAYVRALRPHAGDALLEAHLMIETPEAQFEPFAEAGCRRIIFHAEATRHAHRLVQTLRSLGVSPGIAINPGTAVESILPLIHEVDLVLAMTVNPGWGGQKFLPFVLEKVRQLRALRADLAIEVDGGVDPQTLPIVREAGADVFVVGSHLAKASDLPAETRRMVELTR